MHCAHRDNTWKDQLTKIIEYTNLIKTKEIAYTYDANGNPTAMTDLMVSNNSKTLNWDGRQLSSFSYYCGGEAFKYNDQGIRTRKQVGWCGGGYAVDYVLDGGRILAETKGSSTIYYTYDADGTLISMNYNGNEYFYITNMQGDVVELVDISGNTVVKYKYDAWGAIIYQYDSGLGVANANPFRYRSYYYDSETGWYYLQSRYYNPSIGRTISSDGFSMNPSEIPKHSMYSYCYNNSVMYSSFETRSSSFASDGIELLQNDSSLISSNAWKSSWFNSKGSWYDWTGSIFQSTTGVNTVSYGSAKFGILRISNTGFLIINARLDRIRVDYMIANEANVYATVGSASAFLGFDYKQGIGIYAKASALSIGGTIGPVGGRVDIGSVGFSFAFENGKLEVGAAAMFGYSISIDITWILEQYTEPIVKEFVDEVTGGE